MGTSLRGLSLKSFGETLTIAILTLSAIIFAIVAAARDPGRNVHEAVMSNLRAVDVNHASLQRDVLRARAGLLSSYDPLVSSVVKLRQTTAELKRLFSAQQFADILTLHQALDELRNIVGRDEKLVEEFKTRNALLQNSIGVFGQTLTDLHGSRDKAVTVALARVGDLGNLMMRFSTRPDNELHQEIVERLEDLPEFDTAAPVLEGLGTLLIHARMILAVLPKVDAKIAAIQSSETSRRAEVLQSEYLNTAADVSSRAAISRITLGVTATVLCIYVCILVYRLRAKTTRLKRRLNYERVVAELRADMANSACCTFASQMLKSLSVISRFFNARNCAFALCDWDRAEIRRSYCLDLDHKSLLSEIALKARIEAGRPAIFNLDMFGHILDMKSRYDRRPRIKTLCVVTGAGMPDRDTSVMLLNFTKPQWRIPGDEMQLLLATLQMLDEFVDADGSRQEKERLEQRLEHAQRLQAIGTLAGGIAHEFNNVLGAIQGYGEMAVQLLRKPSTTRHYVQEILKSGARAKQIVDQILTFSRKRERTAKPFDVADAVADILPLLRVTLASQVSIDPKLGEGPSVIMGNPLDIHQLVMNLCKNASQASSRGQKVTIRVDVIENSSRRLLSHGEIEAGRHVCLCVEDEGPGINGHALPHIFEPFFTTKAKTGGSGLGLSAVHGIVSVLGGNIDVISQPGKGTAFRLFFPASDLDPIPVSSFFDENAVPIGNGQRVVIAVQDKMLLELYEEKVAALGYEPAGYASIDCLIDRINAGLCADLYVVDRGLLDKKADMLRTLYAVAGGKLLLLSDQALDEDWHSLAFTIRTLRTPFSSASLASAIFDLLRGTSSARL